MRSEPLIGVPCDRRQIGLHPFHAVGEKYVRALVDAGVGTPLLIPSLDPPLAATPLLAHLDGILLTGSPSNIEPHHYSDEPSYAGNLHDPHRDANTLSLIHAAIAARVPILAICRGFQEVNVAFGGTLLQKVQDTPGFDDHREDTTQPLDVQYAPAHAVKLTHGGVLATIAGSDHAMVNSLHGQGVRTLGRELVVEAVAADGLIEAFRLDNPDTFLLAVQWHPEWKVTENLFYLGIFKRFAEAVRRRAHARI
jgi:putative glutamine amidotransferase